MEPQKISAAQEFAALSASVDMLGECPTWRADEKALYWIDVRKPALRRLDTATGAIREWSMPDLVGCYAFRKSGKDVLVGLRQGIANFNIETGAIEMLASPHEGLPNMRFNDGHCDRQGRFWAGTMDDVNRGAVGFLYRFDARGLTRVLDQVVVPNSLCWSPDGRVMYFADGREPVIWAFDLDIETGEISGRREFARMVGKGIPDGATVDAEGFLWSAQYGGGRINRFAPDGRLDRVIPMAVSLPTCVAFGGPDMRTLFITTARQRLSPETLAAEPQAGALLSMETNVSGLPEPGYFE